MAFDEKQREETARLQSELAELTAQMNVDIEMLNVFRQELVDPINLLDSLNAIISLNISIVEALKTEKVSDAMSKALDNVVLQVRPAVNSTMKLRVETYKRILKAVKKKDGGTANAE